MSIRKELNDGPGYYLGCRLTAEELASVRWMITQHYLDRLTVVAPELVETARETGIENYHTLPIQFDHAHSWPKETRLLPICHLDDFTRMDFYRQIEDEYGPVRISHDELNWRLVRPSQPGDVGPVHLDKWFWDGGYGTMPEGYDRFKIWVPIHSEPGANGLLVKPFSQKRHDWKHHFEMRDGIRKPVLDENEEDLDMQLLPLQPGEMVLFHDDLLHGGAVNRGRQCRISIELTILFRKEPAPEWGTSGVRASSDLVWTI
jgi:hypothetical protein